MLRLITLLLCSTMCIGQVTTDVTPRQEQLVAMGVDGVFHFLSSDINGNLSLGAASTTQSPTTSYSLPVALVGLGPNGWTYIKSDINGNIATTGGSSGGSPTGDAGGDLSGTYPDPTVSGINGTLLSGLGTGLLKLTDGVPSLAVAGVDYIAQSTIGTSGAKLCLLSSNCIVSGAWTVPSLVLNGSQTLSGIQGSGTKILAATGTFISGNIINSDINGNAIDSGTALSSLASKIFVTSTAITAGGTLSNSNAVIGTGAGTGGTVNLTGIDSTHQLTIVTGTLPTLSASIVSVTFTATRGHISYCSVTPANSNASLLSGSNMVFMGSNSATTYTLTSGTTALAATLTYIWNINCP